MKNVSLPLFSLILGASLTACTSMPFLAGSAATSTAYQSSSSQPNANNPNNPRTAQMAPGRMSTDSPSTIVAEASGAESGGLIGGNIEKSMDEIDRAKLTGALDHSVGKPVKWVNTHTKVSYVVVPTRKVVINGNPFCRHYTITASSGTRSRSISGTACVGSDGAWKVIK